VYPQADLRPIHLSQLPSLDPAVPRAGEQVAVCTLALTGPPYLPLRTFAGRDDGRGAEAQVDPLLGILSALAELWPGWRALAQIVLCSLPEGWCQPYARMAVEHPLAREHMTSGRPHTGMTPMEAAQPAMAIGALILGLRVYCWYQAGEWAYLGLLAGGVATVGGGAVWLSQRLGQRPIYDPLLVQEKINHVGLQTQIRLAVFAPAEVPRAPVLAQLNRIAGAYRQFTRARSNGLIARPVRWGSRDLSDLSPWRGGAKAVLNAREVAGLWHLPHAEADVPQLERTAARRRLPPPHTLTRGVRIGISEHQGYAAPVCLPTELLRRHLLLVAKTRRGKSSLLLRLAQAVMDAPRGLPTTPTLILVDPHADLADAALGLVARHRASDVVFLNLADHRRPVGLNLIDVGLGWDRDAAVNRNALAIFKKEFTGYWGPRMEDAFRFALFALYEANRAICTADPNEGRDQQYTVLQVPALFSNRDFRRRVLRQVDDPMVTRWWTDFFGPKSGHLQDDIMTPVQTKVHRFAGSRAARAIVGQPRSTIDPRDWVRSGAIVMANTAKGTLGADTSALVGATLLNLIALIIEEQAALTPERRRAVSLIVDEFHTMPGVDYEAIISELAKYGANLILATQSLARLEILDRERERALRATLFSNLDGLFAFNTSADDARYLVGELGAEVDEQDLITLADYHCYARVSVRGQRVPVVSVQLDPPPESDRGVRDELAAASSLRYGRDGGAVEVKIAAAYAAINEAVIAEPDAHDSHLGDDETGVGRSGGRKELISEVVEIESAPV
jgi:hypothetical protein